MRSLLVVAAAAVVVVVVVVVVVIVLVVVVVVVVAAAAAVVVVVVVAVVVVEEVEVEVEKSNTVAKFQSMTQLLLSSLRLRPQRTRPYRHSGKFWNEDTQK